MSEDIPNNRTADADLLTRVGIALTLKLRHTRHGVVVHVDRAAVTLRGMVPTFYDRQLAIEVTRRVAGVLRVRDELTVIRGTNPAAEDSHVNSFPTREIAGVANGAGTENPVVRLTASAGIPQPRQSRGWRTFAVSAATMVRGLFLALLLAISQF